jgi:SAM-dependent MidA family methyltransferase
MPPLPEPSSAARQHSAQVLARILEEIERGGGWIPFARYMELALYAPGLGYYSAGLHKLGESGDFVTAPEISTLFGRTLARQAAQILSETGGDILEIGAGSGRLALDLLLELESLGRLPQRYRILEVSADLRSRQQGLLEQGAPHLAGRVVWLDRLPGAFTGLILGNEVLDALPVNVVAWREDGIYERGVAREGEALRWSERKLTEGGLFEAASRLGLPAGYVSEICPAARGLVASLAAMLERGVMLFLDYGFGESEYYHPQRSRGTLMCHYRHHAHDDPFYLPGLQDITAHVDFSAIARAGAEAGLKLLGYTTQAHFLTNAGITGILTQTPPDDARAYLPLAAEAQRLLSPAEMGELFKAIAFGQGVGGPLIGFARGDRSRLL